MTLFRLSGRKKLLFLSVLVSLVELVNVTGGVNDLDLAGIEGMRGVGDLNLHKRILNTLDDDGLLGVNAGAGDEYIFV